MKLVAAAEDFVVRRGAGPEAGTSIIAGYPWFSDWGRDSAISLPGLLLSTRRFTEARQVLETFAKNRKNGLIPNLFNDRTGEAEYNTVDASLWFLHAACEYRRASGDRAGFDGPIRAACLEIIDAYTRGTDYGIRMDPADGLIAAGDETSQLTWMDAKRDGVVFTPRHGKAVEINALWHHGLVSLAEVVEKDDAKRAAEMRLIAGTVATSFRAKFWNSAKNCCHDVLLPGPKGAWKPDTRLRPNQVFAASLRHSPLEPERRRHVVAFLKGRLLTPMGLRTLEPVDPGYKPRYRGTMWDRDAAYHNGTVWPWLLGPYAEAVLRAGEFSTSARLEALGVLRPLIARLDRESLGQLPEVFDADDSPEDPRRPGGCVAQAWSVAETLRVLLMALTPAAGPARDAIETKPAARPELTR
jgi:predicted glycogen debranching enzyme